METPKKDLRTGTPYWPSLGVPKVLTRALERDITTDVVIIGAGITGAMAAEELSAAGFKVTVIDRRAPLRGATTATTALLQYEIDQPLILLKKQIGEEKAVRAWRRSYLGLGSLRSKIASLNIRCDMRERASLYLAGDVLDANELRYECEARRLAGFHTDFCTRTELLNDFGIRRSAALHSYDSLTVNPMMMAAGFLRAALKNKAQIFAPVAAAKVEPGSKVRVYTKTGHTITANYVIYASGYEMPASLMKSRHSIHSTYAIATKPQKKKLWPSECVIWEASDPYHYLRTTTDGRVICGGEDEDFEDDEKRDALLTRKTTALEKGLAKLFPQLDPRAEFSWCGSFGVSKTGLPTIGAIEGMKNCFAILAFGGNGITYSRIAAEILAAELKGKKDRDADLFAF